MPYNHISDVFLLLISTNESENNSMNSSDKSLRPLTSISIAFYIGQAISILSIIFGIFGNSALILIIYRSLFYRFPFGLLLLFIAFFDIIYMISTIIYYLIHSYIIPLNLFTLTIYINLYRYPKNITNWLKVFLAFERILAIKSWSNNRYNINSITRTKHERTKQKQTFIFIIILLICSLISQHPNFIPIRFISPRIDPTYLLLLSTPNPYFYYGRTIFHGLLFTIMSYIILDDLLPIILLISLNTILLFKLRHLPLLTSEKLSGSLWIIFFLTIFSIFILPRSIILLITLYLQPKNINDTILSIFYHLFQGFEMINHAITGYTCFLSCQNLRKNLVEFSSKILQKPLYTFEPATIELRIKV